LNTDPQKTGVFRPSCLGECSAEVQFVKELLATHFLFAIAVIAVNCGVLRLGYEMFENALFGDAPLSILPFSFVGSLPLINVALIGSLRFVVRSLRSFRGVSGANPRPSPAAVTYFSIHFLAILTVVTIFMPGAIESYLETLSSLMDYAAKGWSTVISRFEDSFPWVVLGCLMFGVFISGPALLLSWIGGLLARRCAATLPQDRFRTLTCLVSLSFAGVALAIAVTPRPFADEQDVDLDFQIFDKESGQPIGAAVLRITDAFNATSIPPKAFTGVDGRAQLTARFEANGQRNAFRTMGAFSPWGRWLEVSAADYRTVQMPLPDVLGRHTDLESACLQMVSLTKGKTPEGSFHDIAGSYNQLDMVNAGCSFEIEPDGRFAWHGWGCAAPDEQEYGYLKQNEGEIELVPIPQAGRTIHPVMTLRYKAIKWGDRLYLSTTEDQDLQSFCQAAVTPKHVTSSGVPHWVYVRESDREKPQTGFPQLPAKVWVKFLVDKITHRDEESQRELALKALLSRTSANGQVPAP
jgi:hypothetical protein